MVFMRRLLRSYTAVCAPSLDCRLTSLKMLCYHTLLPRPCLCVLTIMLQCTKYNVATCSPGHCVPHPLPCWVSVRMADHSPVLSQQARHTYRVTPLHIQPPPLQNTMSTYPTPLSNLDAPLSQPSIQHMLSSCVSYPDC